ncbi:MAG: hypothetical protein JXR32_09585 [Anaerolineaceae bacterium]|nr:hypothetical protein [Anaerolineaceae bacterium]
MRKLPLFCSVILLLYQSACADSPEVPDEWVNISITPNLVDYQSLIYDCAQATSLNIQTTVQPSPNLASGEYDVVIQIGQPSDEHSFHTQIGTVEIIFVINPSNPVTEVSQQELGAILLNMITDWHTISPQMHPMAFPIHVWNYPPGDDVREMIETTLLSGQSITQSHLAPDQSAMLEAILADPAAIGVILNEFPHESIKELAVQSILPLNFKQPVIASFAETPSGELQELTACLVNQAD